MCLSKSLVAELGQYRKKLESCETHLKASTQLLQVSFSSFFIKNLSEPQSLKRLLLLQELTWSQAHFSNKLNISSTESVWPELLLQSNMEKVPTPSLHVFMKSFRNETFVYLQFDKVQESFAPLEQQTHTFQTHLQGLGDGHLQGGPVAPTDGAPVSSPPPQTSTKTPPLSLRERTARLSSSLKRLHRAGKQK